MPAVALALALFILDSGTAERRDGRRRVADAAPHPESRTASAASVVAPVECARGNRHRRPVNRTPARPAAPQPPSDGKVRF